MPIITRMAGWKEVDNCLCRRRCASLGETSDIEAALHRLHTACSTTDNVYVAPGYSQRKTT